MNTVTFEIRPHQENYFKIWIVSGSTAVPVGDNQTAIYPTIEEALKAIAGGITFAG